MSDQLRHPPRRTLVRYTVKPGRGPENIQAVERVFAELATAAPPGLRYAAFHAGDGLSFVHLVSHEEPDGVDALRALPAFQAFRAGIVDRCETQPVATPLHAVGDFRLLGA